MQNRTLFKNKTLFLGSSFSQINDSKGKLKPNLKLLQAQTPSIDFFVSLQLCFQFLRSLSLFDSPSLYFSQLGFDFVQTKLWRIVSIRFRFCSKPSSGELSPAANSLKSPLIRAPTN
ncbi:hypothetical protein ACP275_14G099600 [Erythranthe tilingii]